EAVESAASLFPAPTAFSFDLPRDTAIRADAQWLRQILTNLFRNAVQAQEEAETPHPQINIKASLQETCLLLHVRDNGPGIAPERQERIFEPHFTTRSAGSGLGLAISRRLAEGMQGALTFAPATPTEAGETLSGAHFVLRLPLA
ncbi:MAG: ATP-binding protein, partial [Bacteroidales bacterium]|nr:ATP-binding protein [Bacteroidales bacterium]